MHSQSSRRPVSNMLTRCPLIKIAWLVNCCNNKCWTIPLILVWCVVTDFNANNQTRIQWPPGLRSLNKSVKAAKTDINNACLVTLSIRSVALSSATSTAEFESNFLEAVMLCGPSMLLFPTVAMSGCNGASRDRIENPTDWFWPRYVALRMRKHFKTSLIGYVPEASYCGVWQTHGHSWRCCVLAQFPV